ncbi:MAG: ABC transporter ATP-binding protein, partial [Patescibacteria group bacterium]
MFFSQNPIVYLTAKMWQYSRGNRRSVVLFYVLFFLNNIVEFFRPFVVALMLNIIQSQGVSKTNIRSLALMLLLFPIFTVVAWALHGPARVLERKNSFLVRAHYKKFLLDGTMALPASWHADHQSGDTLDRITKGTEALYEFSGTIFEIIGAVMILATSIGALVYFDLPAGAIAVAAVFFTFALVLVFDAKLSGQYRQLNRAENTIAAKIFDVISNVTTVIILRLEKLVSQDINAKVLQPLQLYVRNISLNEWKWFLVNLSGSIMTFLVMASYLFAAAKSSGAIAIGTIFLLYEYVRRIEDVFFRFAWTYSGLVKKKTQVANAEELAADFRRIAKSRTAVPKNWREIRFERLNFSYHAEEGADLHLTDIYFEIRRGEKIALIGASGSGKTTLLKVLRGLYVPSKVKMSINGNAVADGLKALGDTISLIPQDPEIFATTIRENITVGLKRSEKEIRTYTDMARFSDVAERLPNKLDSSIFEKGVNLSGGEKQRLALARGLMASQDKTIVLLDEPTSSVDAVNEQAIYQNI